MKQHIKQHIWLHIGTAICVVLLLLSVLGLLPYYNINTTQVEGVTFVGTYQESLKDAPKQFTAQTEIVATEQNTLILQGHFNRPLNQSEQLMFYMPYIEVEIFVDGQRIFAFGTQDGRPDYIRSSGASWGHCVLPKDITADAPLQIVLHNAYTNNYDNAYQQFLNSLLVGDSGALARTVAAENWPYILFGIVFPALSFALLLVALMLHLHKRVAHASVFYCVYFIMGISLWVLLDPRYSTLVIRNTAMIMLLEIISPTAAAAFLLQYIQNFLVSKAAKFNRWLLASVLGVISAMMLLQWSGLADTFEVRDFVVPFVSVVCVAIALEIAYELKHNDNKILRFLAWPGLVMLCFGVLEAVNYNVDLMPRGQIACMGLSIFIGTQLVLAVRYLAHGIWQVQRAAQLEKELADSRIAIMLSQIQPHFLFNSLTAIQQLCVEDPLMAEQSVTNFAKYLRGNINALGSAALIPFTKELDHVRAYLELEQMRFQDKLRVEFDIGVEAFLLPSLTVQPIVENAVRYGVGRRDIGGTVRIVSWEDEGWYYIEVADDGVGFCPNVPPGDGKKHIGIDNVRDRLAGQCGGRLEIDSQPNQGTKVKIIIPKEHSNENFNR